MKKQIEKIIKRYYKKTTQWEKCGEKIYKLIDSELDKLYETPQYKESNYSTQIKMKNNLKKELEDTYESFFVQKNFLGVNAGFDWINGNEKLKQLLK